MAILFNSVSLLACYCLCALLLCGVTVAFQPTTDAPLLDSPTYSLATLNEDGSTNMNIVTYATPASIRPDRIWSLGVYKETLSYRNIARNKNNPRVVLQLLTEEQAELVVTLGGFSGSEVDKQKSCAEMGFEWQDLGDGTGIQVLPKCAHYLSMSVVEEMIDGGSHLIVPSCKVEGMYKGSEESKHLMTSKLRELGIVTALGRVSDERKEAASPVPRQE